MKILFALALILSSQAVLAICPEHSFTDPDKVVLNGNSVLIVTHASMFYDARLSSKRGVDEAVSFAKSGRMPVVYLQDDSPRADYFMNDCAPDYWVHSQDGELKFEVRPTNVYIVGGHLEKCMYTTVENLLAAWAKQPMRNLMLTFFMDGIYSNGELVEKSDPFYGDFEIFMRAVTRGRQSGEYWPKLNLLETMGVINREEDELEYLKKALPDYERIMPASYRVELQMNNSVVKVLRSAPGRHPPTLRFRFVDSSLTVVTPGS